MIMFNKNGKMDGEILRDTNADGKTIGSMEWVICPQKRLTIRTCLYLVCLVKIRDGYCRRNITVNYMQ